MYDYIQDGLKFRNIVEIGDNLYIDRSSFHEFNPELIHPLLSQVAGNVLCGKSAKTIPPCVIHPASDGNPKCCNSVAEPIVRHIYLTAKRNFIDQWVYQFAHEYCHHTINGPMSGYYGNEPIGLVWFEETICELSSLYELYLMAGQMASHPSQILQANAISVLSTAEYYRTESEGLRRSLRLAGGIFRFLRPLAENRGYQREFYMAVAFEMLPLFQQNPNLWKILRHIGDINRYGSIQELLTYLRATADDSYRESLDKMIALLLA